MGADLPPAAVLRDHRHVEPGERPHVPHRQPRRRRDENHDFLAAEARDDLTHARVPGAGGGIDAAQQLELSAEVGGERRLGEAVEIVGLAPAVDGDHGRGAGVLGDGPGLARRLLEVRQRDLVGVGVAGPLSGLGADPGPLTQVARGLLDGALLQDERLGDAILEIEVRVIHAACQAGPEQPLHGGRRQAEPVLEESLWVRKHFSLRGALRRTSS